MVSVTQYGTGDPLTVIIRPSLTADYRAREQARADHMLAEGRRLANDASALHRILKAAAPFGADDCWEWRGNLSHNGYGQMAFHGKNRQAHRVAYELMVGPIPNGLVLDHLCVNRRCFNPRHLEPVTQAVNLVRCGAAEAAAALNRAKRTCKRGHPLSGENVVLNSRGHRRCRTCIRASANAGYHRRKEQANV